MVWVVEKNAGRELQIDEPSLKFMGIVMRDESGKTWAGN